MKNKIPPPVILLTFGAMMWLVAKSGVAYPISMPYSLPLAIATGATGMCFAILAVRQFRAARTTINPLEPAKASSLVSDGVFRWSRNPMYVGLLLVLAGWTIWLGSLTNIVLLLVFVLTMNELQIKPEENAMHTLFGEEYASYSQQVRRWL